MTKYYCQMRLIEDGIRCNQQPPQDDCCNQPAHNYIVIYGEKQWLCAECCDGHMSLRGVLHYDGLRCSSVKLPRSSTGQLPHWLKCEFASGVTRTGPESPRREYFYIFTGLQQNHSIKQLREYHVKIELLDKEGVTPTWKTQE